MKNYVSLQILPYFVPLFYVIYAFIAIIYNSLLSFWKLSTGAGFNNHISIVSNTMTVLRQYLHELILFF